MSGQSHVSSKTKSESTHSRASNAGAPLQERLVMQVSRQDSRVRIRRWQKMLHDAEDIILDELKEIEDYVARSGSSCPPPSQGADEDQRPEARVDATMSLHHDTMEETERRERIDRHRLRRERREQMAKMRGMTSGRAVIQDRSKSKAARIREEAKRRKHSGRSEGSSPSSRVEIVVYQEKRKRNDDRQHSPRKSTKSFMSAMDRYHYEDHGRGRIVLPSTKQGIFSRGASSGQHATTYKELPSQTDSEMARRISKERSKRARQTVMEASSASKGSQFATSSAKLVQENIRLEGHLKAAVHGLLHRNKDKKKKQIEIRETYSNDEIVPPPSPNPTSDAHSAYSRAQRLKRQEDIMLGARAIPLPKTNTALYHTEQKVQKKEEESSLTPELHNTVPPLLAFDGNKPHQHANGWRNQHTRHETDISKLRQRYEEMGGPDLRSCNIPIEDMIGSVQHRREENVQKESCDWEVMAAECDEPYEGQQLLTSNLGSEPVFDYAVGGEQQQQKQEYAGQEQAVQENQDHLPDYAEYLEYGPLRPSVQSPNHNYYSEDGYTYQMDEDWYDNHDADRCDDSWVDQVSVGDVDRGDPFKCGVNEGKHACSSSYNDQRIPTLTAALAKQDLLRAAVQPTPEDLPRFWTAQR